MPVVEVSVGGVAVSDGATLSTTGEMQVTCNVPYVLTVNGVKWMPVASVGGVDTFLLSTSGVVRIFINGTRYFLFKNTITVDFQFDLLDVNEMTGDDVINTIRVRGGYYQGPIAESSNRVIMNLNRDLVSPSMSRDDIVALGASCSQGDVTIYKSESQISVVQIEVNNFSTSEYNAVFVGNVLVAFFEPAE